MSYAKYVNHHQNISHYQTGGELAMSQPMEEMLSDWLSDTLNIMVCTESTNVSSSIISYIGRYPSFKLHRTSTEKMLDLYFSQDIEWHSIIIDGQLSFTDKVFQYISAFPSWTPVILLAEEKPTDILSEWCIEENSENKYSYFDKENRNIGSIIETCKRRDFPKLLSVILSNSLKKQFFLSVPNNEIHEAVNILYKENPLSVEEWAKIYGVATRKMQRILRPFAFATPKKLLNIYHAYRMVFAEVDNSGNLNCEVFKSHKLDKTHRERFLEYVLSRRSTLLKCSVG